MKVEVLSVTPTNKDFNVVHAKVGQLYGDLIATKEVDKPGTYFLKSSLRVEAGRIVPRVRVEPIKG